MLYMVIESFRNTDPIRERFARQGRMLPKGVTYHASWVEPSGAECFQLMETPDHETLKPWMSRWDDLIDFEIIAVLTSSDLWSKAQRSGTDLPAAHAGRAAKSTSYRTTRRPRCSQKLMERAVSGPVCSPRRSQRLAVECRYIHHGCRTVIGSLSKVADHSTAL